MLKGFREFISRGNAIDLAVGVVIGAAFTSVITAIVNGLLTPLIALLFSTEELDSVMLGPFAVGSVIGALINFLLVAAALYFFVVAPMNSLAKRRAPKEEAPAAATEVELLAEIKDLLAKQSE